MGLRHLAALLLCLAAPAAALASETEADGPPRHGIAMHGEPALPEGFSHLPYANPDAPRGGRVALGFQGTFDSLNPLIVIGVAPDALPRYVLQSLMMRSADEPFTVYGLIARSVEMPSDRSAITFNLDPRARFSDGHPLTAEDVRFTFESLKADGKPFHRSSFSAVKAVEILDPHRIRFDLTGANDRELPLIIATMPIFPAHATDPARFKTTSLSPTIGSGPYAFAEVKPGERVVLKRRTDFWAEDLPILRGLYNFDEIRYDFYRDANTLFEAFKTGLYDIRFEGEPGRWATEYDFPAIAAGRIRRETLPVRVPKGMNGYVFNMRRPLFSDIRVREALGLMFDFDWVNRNLFFGVLTRSDSFFAGSDLSSQGRPAGEQERRLLAPFADAVRSDILEGRWAPPSADGSGRDRDQARQALALLAAAGFVLDGSRLRRRDTGEPFAFEIMVNSRAAGTARAELCRRTAPHRRRGACAARRRRPVLAAPRPLRVRHDPVDLAGNRLPRQRAARPLGLAGRRSRGLVQSRRRQIAGDRRDDRRSSRRDRARGLRCRRARPRPCASVRLLRRAPLLCRRFLARLPGRSASPGDGAPPRPDPRHLVARPLTLRASGLLRHHSDGERFETRRERWSNDGARPRGREQPGARRSPA